MDMEFFILNYFILDIKILHFNKIYCLDDF